MIPARLKNLFNFKPSQKEVDAFASSAGGGRNDDVKKFLRKYRYAIDRKNDVGNTALICAASNGRRDTVDLLLENGADTTAKSYYGQVFLIYAARLGYKDIVEKLLEEGADINEKNANDYTVLMGAATCGHGQTVKLLLDKGAAIDLRSDDGWTALMLAARYWHKDIVEMLLDKGADIEARNGQGKTALMLAREHDENDGNEAVALLEQWPEIEKQRLAEDIADFSPELKRKIPYKGPLKPPRQRSKIMKIIKAR